MSISEVAERLAVVGIKLLLNSELTGLLKTKASIELRKWYLEGKIDKDGRAPHIVYKKKEVQTGTAV